MKRSVVALGILGLVCAVALPAGSAAVLLKDDFSSDPFKGVAGVYAQGVGDSQRSDPTLPPFFVREGVLTSSAADSTAGSDGVTTADADPPGVRFLLLTGDPSWADVSIQAKIRIDGQNTGGVALVLRAAAKAKPADPDTWYEFRSLLFGRSVAIKRAKAAIPANPSLYRSAESDRSIVCYTQTE